MKKVKKLIHAIERKGISCSFIALDISRKSIEKGLQYLDIDDFKYVKVSGICGTFEEGVDYLMEIPNQRIALFLGSTIFNDCEPSAKEAQKLCGFMRSYPEDVIYASQDGHTGQDAVKVEAAYHTEAFERFIWHGVEKLSKAMGLKDDPHCYWEVDCGLRTSPEGTFSHFWQLQAKQAIKWEDITIKAGEVHEFFESRKSRPERVRQLLCEVGLLADVWQASDSQSC
jgi:L-histidine Nalpha-methyltransferase / hercynylcysteine S-oxide synthase